MPQGKVNNLRNANGDVVKGDSSIPITYNDPEKFEYAMAQATENFAATIQKPKFAYTRTLDVNNIVTDENGSSAQVFVVDPSLTKLPQYDNKFGFKYDKTIADRHYVSVVKLDRGNPDEAKAKDAKAAGTEKKVDPVKLPKEGEDYDKYGGKNKSSVLFCGFNDTGCNFNLRGDTVNMSYVGMENVLNDVQINGIVEFNLQSGVVAGIAPGDGVEAVRFTFGKACIFNEDGEADRYKGGVTGLAEVPQFKEKGDTSGPVIGTPFFNKSGFGLVQRWTLKDILFYVLGWHVGGETNLIGFLPDDVFSQSKKYKNNFIDVFNLSDPVLSILDSIEPPDFSLEGLGAWDAIKKILDESKKAIISIKYTVDNTFQIFVRSKILSDRAADDLEMPIDRGEFGTPYDKKRILEDSSLNCNREFSKVGRIIVLGDNLMFNSLATTLTNQKDTSTVFMSSSLASLVAPTAGLNGVADFENFISLVPVLNDEAEKGVKSRIYKFHNYHMIGEDTAGPGNSDSNIIPLSEADLNVTSTPRFFDSLSILDAVEGIQPAYGEIKLQKDKAVAGYVTDAMKEDAATFRTFFKIIPLEDSTVFSQQFIAAPLSGVSLKQKALQGGAFQDVEDGSKVTTAFKDDGALMDPATTKLLPLFFRCTFISDFRIRGEAKITSAIHGEDFDEKKHLTKYIVDRSFKFSMSYQDATFNKSEGAFTAIANGYIKLANGSEDPDRKKPLEAIQAAAEALLDKYVTVPQNSGSYKITGIQDMFQVGDYSKKIESSSPTNPSIGTRSINFPVIIKKVEYIINGDDSNKTILSLGAIDDEEE